jgi:hypothetical protein
MTSDETRFRPRLLQEPAKKAPHRVAYVFADVRLSPSEMLGISVSFTRREWGEGVIVSSSHRKRQAEYIGRQHSQTHLLLLPPVPLLSPFLFTCS